MKSDLNPGWHQPAKYRSGWALKLGRLLEISVHEEIGHRGGPKPMWCYVLPWGRSKFVFATAEDAMKYAERHALKDIALAHAHLEAKTSEAADGPLY